MKSIPNLPLWLLAVMLLFATAFLAIPGYLTWDSGTYHLMVRALYDTRGFFIPNGYEEYGSPLLVVGHTMAKNGALVSQYPEYYTLLSLPFYALFGYRGLMILNTVAFVGICALIWRMARWFSDERSAPLAAVVVYALATYAIGFTQSSYPHLTSTVLICAAIWLVWGAALQEDNLPSVLPRFIRSAQGRCAIAGFLFGVAIGVRLDSIFAGLALALPFLTFRSLGWRCLAAGAVGGLFVLAGLGAINAIKFGTFLPFSYGRTGGYTGSVTVYLPIAAVIALAAGMLALHQVRPIRLGRRGTIVALLAIACALVFTAFGQRLLNGVFQLVVDMRIRPEIQEPALSRSPGGAVVYWLNVKKSLLESCPYLVLIVLPALRALFVGGYGNRWLLWLVPAGFIGFYGFLAWHGSVGWDMRYFNPTLPFFALLASHELLRLRDHIPVRRPVFWISVGVLWIVFVLAIVATQPSLVGQERLILDGGLLLAGLLLSCQVAEQFTTAATTAAFQRIMSGILVIALVWSSALAVAVDYRLSATIRSFYFEAAQFMQPRIPNNALIMTYQPNFVWALLDTDKRPLIANYRLGSVQDSVDLIERAIGHRAVVWISPSKEYDLMGPAVFAALESKGIHAESVAGETADGRYRLFLLRKTPQGHS